MRTSRSLRSVGLEVEFAHFVLPKAAAAIGVLGVVMVLEPQTSPNSACCKVSLNDFTDAVLKKKPQKTKTQAVEGVRLLINLVMRSRSGFCKGHSLSMILLWKSSSV